MQDIVAVVQEVDVFNTVQIQEQDLISVSTTLFNPPTVPRLADIGDVDTQNLANGSVLVYKTTTNKWVATTTLDLQNMEGGEF
jgi:hypothetical protein